MRYAEYGKQKRTALHEILDYNTQGYSKQIKIRFSKTQLCNSFSRSLINQHKHSKFKMGRLSLNSKWDELVLSSRVLKNDKLPG